MAKNIIDDNSKNKHKILKFIRTQKYNPRYLLVLRFTAALLYKEYKIEEDGNSEGLTVFWEAIESSPRDLSQTGHTLLVMQLLDECESNTEIKVHKELFDKVSIYILKVLRLPNALQEGFVFREEIIPILAKSKSLKYSKSMEEIFIFIIKTLEAGDEDARSNAAEALKNLGKVSKAVIAALSKALRDHSEWVCVSAAKALGNLGQTSDNIIAGLIEALQDERSGILRYIAAEALGNLGQASEDIITALMETLSSSGYENLEVQIETQKALVKLGLSNSKVIEVLIKALNSEDFEVQSNSVGALMELGQSSPEAIAFLMRALEDKNKLVCIRAAKALGGIGQATPEVIANLLRALEDNDHDVCISVARSLVQLGHSSPKVMEVLINAFGSNDFRVRSNAADALGNLDKASPTVIAILIRALEDIWSDVCGTAAEALGNLGQSTLEVIAALNKALKYVDDDPDARISVAEALVKLNQANSEVIATTLIEMGMDEYGDSYLHSRVLEILGKLSQASPTVIATLVNALRDEDVGVQSEAVDALVKLGQSSPEVTAILIEALEDNDSNVRSGAIETLGKLGQSSPALITAMIKALKDNDSGVRSAAMKALGKLRQSDPTLISAIIKSLRDENSYVRRSASKALRKLLNTKNLQKVITYCCTNRNINFLNEIAKSCLCLGIAFNTDLIKSKRHQKLVIQSFMNAAKALKLPQYVYNAVICNNGNNSIESKVEIASTTPFRNYKDGDSKNKTSSGSRKRKQNEEIAYPKQTKKGKPSGAQKNTSRKKSTVTTTPFRNHMNKKDSSKLHSGAPATTSKKRKQNEEIAYPKQTKKGKPSSAQKNNSCKERTVNTTSFRNHMDENKVSSNIKAPPKRVINPLVMEVANLLNKNYSKEQAKINAEIKTYRIAVLKDLKPLKYKVTLTQAELHVINIRKTQLQPTAESDDELVF
ncbi:MAG: hypothetical protein COB50_01985 [Thiotrichales bacterium]|nr:MAG: hypothetical protein COB50_01985 [Thiotrichales bacterium]